jgi:hypothetical protein
VLFVGFVVFLSPRSARENKQLRLTVSVSNAGRDEERQRAA